MSIKLLGADQLFAKLGAVEASRTLVSPMQRSVLRLQRKMAVYPPERPASKYIRTGTLGRRWTTNVEQHSDGVTGRVGNNTEYAPLVQSSQFQTRVHEATGWTTDQQALDDETDNIVRDFHRAIDEALA